MKIAIYFWNRLLPTEYRVIRADFELKSKACSVRNTQLSSKYLKTAKDWGKIKILFFENKNTSRELFNGCFHVIFGPGITKILRVEVFRFLTFLICSNHDKYAIFQILWILGLKSCLHMVTKNWFSQDWSVWFKIGYI